MKFTVITFSILMGLARATLANTDSSIRPSSNVWQKPYREVAIALRRSAVPSPLISELEAIYASTLAADPTLEEIVRQAKRSNPTVRSADVGTYCWFAAQVFIGGAFIGLMVDARKEKIRDDEDRAEDDLRRRSRHQRCRDDVSELLNRLGA